MSIAAGLPNSILPLRMICMALQDPFSPSDLGRELCRYQPKSLGDSLPEQVVLRWLLYVVCYLFFLFTIALGGCYLAAPLLLLGDKACGLAAGSVWRSILGWSTYVACCAVLASVCFVWPRFVYLVVYEKGFVYHAMCRRYTVSFSEIARCFLARDSSGITLVLRDSTRLRFHLLAGHFRRECVGQLFDRISEHLNARPLDTVSMCQTAAMAAPRQHREIAIPNSLWSFDALLGPGVPIAMFLCPALFAVISLAFFSLDCEGKICTWLLLSFCLVILWFIFLGIWEPYKRGGGLREFCRDLLSFFAWKHSLESVPQDHGPPIVRYGFQLLGHHHPFFKVPLDRIEAVEWRQGQSKSWAVLILCSDCGTQHGITSIGPCRGITKTESLGLAIVDFLRCAGAMLTEGEDEKTYRRL
jgi:hypothetical protein